MLRPLFSFLQNKRSFAVILSLLLVVTPLAACQSGDEGDPSDTAGSIASSDDTSESSTSESDPSNTSETEETTTSQTETSVKDDVKRAEDLVMSDYDAYSNELINWWYRRPEQLGQENRETIDQGVKNKVDPFQALYQDPSDARRLYLTFDAGYEYENNTAEILDILADKNVKASFFVTGDYIDQSPHVVKRMLNEGHLVANHSLKHKNPVKTLDAEGIYEMALDIQANAEKFAALTGAVMPYYLRPGEGAYSEKVLAIYADMGYQAVFWDFAYRDWLVEDQHDPADALAQITGELHPGSVLLLHAVSDTNVTVLPDVIDFAVEGGYSFHLVSEHP